MERPHCEPRLAGDSPRLALRQRMLCATLSLAAMIALAACASRPPLPSQAASQAKGDASPDPWKLQAAFEIATDDARIEAGLAAAQGWLQRQEIQRAEQVLEALAETPGTTAQQAHYALLMGEIRLHQQRPEDARRWLERAAGALSPSLESRRVHALALLPQPQAAITASLPPANPIAYSPSASHQQGFGAVLLPTGSRLGGMGHAIQDGIMRAYLEQVPTQRARLKFFPIGDQPASAATAARQAVEGGAASIIGPLDKPAVDQVIREIPPTMPMLALNRLETTRPGLIQFGLPPEDDARAVAEGAFASGRRQAWVIIPQNDWGERLLIAFDSAFTARGGRVISTTRYPPHGSDFQIPLRQGWTQARNPDMIFLAAFAPQAQLLLPQIRFIGAGTLPVYATSAIDDGTRDRNEDLDGLRFPQMPWLHALNHPTQPSTDPAFLRMQAFGFDAYHLWQALIANSGATDLPLNGATGMLTMTPDGRVLRSNLPWAYYANGRVIPGLPDEPAPPLSP